MAIERRHFSFIGVPLGAKRWTLSHLGPRSASLVVRVAAAARSRRRASGALLREAGRRLLAGEDSRACALLEAITPELDHHGLVRAVELMAQTHETTRVILYSNQVLRSHALGTDERLRVVTILCDAYNKAGQFDESVRLLSEEIADTPANATLRATYIECAARLHDDTALAATLVPQQLRQMGHSRLARLLDVLAEEGLWRYVEQLVASAHTLRLRDTAGAMAKAVSEGHAQTAQTLVLAIRNRERPRAWYRLGRTLERNKSWRLAADAYKESVADGAGRPEWHYRLGAALDRIGDRANASDAYQMAIAATPHAQERGIVAPFGDLVKGWLPETVNHQEPVLIKLNGETIAWTRSTEPVRFSDGTIYRPFRRRVKDLRKFLGRGDAVEVEHDGKQVPITGSKDGVYVCQKGISRSIELKSQIAHGFVFNELGRLQQSRATDTAWQTAVVGLFNELREAVFNEFGVDLMPFYGTLLGAIREQDFISYDHDFDTAFISPASSPVEVRQYFQAVCRYLIDRGYDLTVKNAYAQVRLADRRGPKVDIFFAWFTTDGLFQASWGYHGAGLRQSDQFRQMTTALLGNHEVLVPVNAEAILAQLYGPTWRVPDPGWTQHKSTRTLPDEYHLTDEEVNDLYWLQFYRDHKIANPSPFARFTQGRLDRSCTVVEFGCGNGRDSTFFAKLGHTVWAADRSPTAIEDARASGRELGLPATFSVVDVASPQQVTEFLNAVLEQTRRPAEVVVYLRFFFHAIAEEVEDTLLKSIVDTLGSGFRLFAEFRTDEDKDQAKTFGGHYRRYINEHEFVDKLESVWDFQIEHLEAGTGLSPWKDEDPYLARIVARR